MILVALSWGLSIVLYHFQPQAGPLELSFDAFVVGLNFFSVYQLLTSNSNRSIAIKVALSSISLGGFLLGITALLMHRPTFYEYWSKLGAGTMRVHNQVYIFGDLAHLTSAAGCPAPVVIGANLCDPWERLFNQNPQVVLFFRFFHMTNVKLIGFLAVLSFAVCIVAGVKFLKIENLSLFMILTTPPILLAVDRGNELITITLIVVSLYFLSRDALGSQCLGIAAITAAILFKLWPIILLFFLLVFHWRRIRFEIRIVAIFPFIYLISLVHKIKPIIEATQQGSPLGISFGAKLSVNSQLSTFQSLFLISVSLVFFFFLVRSTEGNLRLFMRSALGMKALTWISPLMLTYCLIWAISESFMYRMVILVPVVMILSKPEIFEFKWPKLILTAILVTCITSTMPIAIAVSSALALYFIYVVFMSRRVDTSALRM